MRFKSIIRVPPTIVGAVQFHLLKDSRYTYRYAQKNSCCDTGESYTQMFQKIRGFLTTCNFIIKNKKLLQSSQNLGNLKHVSYRTPPDDTVSVTCDQLATEVQNQVTQLPYNVCIQLGLCSLYAFIFLLKLKEAIQLQNTFKNKICFFLLIFYFKMSNLKNSSYVFIPLTINNIARQLSQLPRN